MLKVSKSEWVISPKLKPDVSKIVSSDKLTKRDVEEYLIEDKGAKVHKYKVYLFVAKAISMDDITSKQEAIDSLYHEIKKQDWGMLLLMKWGKK